MEFKEEVSGAGFETFVFKSAICSTGDHWWKENPIATVKITKVANWVMLWFEELIYKEVLPWHFIERYTTRRAERLIFETKLPERFRPRKKIRCEVRYFGNIGEEDGLDVLPDGSIQTSGRRGFELPTPESAAGWGSGECAYATDAKQGALNDWAQKMIEDLREFSARLEQLSVQLAEHGKKIAEIEEHQRQHIGPETRSAASRKKDDDDEPGAQAIPTLTCCISE